MENRCQRCGTPATSEQAFCAKCGAVIGMADTGRGPGQSLPNLAATVVGKKLPGEKPAPPPAARPRSAAPRAASRGSNSWLLAIIGFVAVLVVGGLLVLLFLLRST